MQLLKGDVSRLCPRADLNRVRKDAIDHMFDRLPAAPIQNPGAGRPVTLHHVFERLKRETDQHLKLVVSHRNNLGPSGLQLTMSRRSVPEVTYGWPLRPQLLNFSALAARSNLQSGIVGT